MASEKTLATRTRKELAQMAKYNKVEGWHSMKKAELIEALKNRRLRKSPQESQFAQRSQALRAEADSSRVALRRSTGKPPGEDVSEKTQSRPPRLQANARPGEREQLLATALGSYWVAVSWTLSDEILDRAEASLGRDRHFAVPVLRVFDVNRGDDANPAKCCLATISLHGGVDHWYVPIADPSRTYELQIGYQTAKGRFFLLARSAAVKLPQPGSSRARRYEEQRSMEGHRHARADANHRFPIRGAAACRISDDVTLEAQADLCITGKATPHAHVTCQEEPVPTGADGRFEVRLALEEGRQVIPLEAVSADGSQSRTVILAIERNTKTLEPQSLNEWD